MRRQISLKRDLSIAAKLRGAFISNAADAQQITEISICDGKPLDARVKRNYPHCVPRGNDFDFRTVRSLPRKLAAER